MKISLRPAKSRRKIQLFVIFSLFLCVCPRDCFAQADSQNAALLAFKREQIALIEAEIARRESYALPELSRALAQTQMRAGLIEKTVGDAAKTLENLHERAYFAPDGSAQPFWIALPRNYSPNRKWPLIVYLHGYSTDISKINPWFPPVEVLQAATSRGFILAIPYGRRNSDFVQWGQDDVLTVKNEVQRLYSINSARTFLAGASMGGYGAYAVALHDPSPWAAVAPVCGRTDFYLWFKTPRESLSPWKRALYDADDPRFLISNARQTPFYVQHGARDATVPVEHSRLFAADAAKAKLPVFYQEQSDGDHWFDFQIAAITRAFDWFTRVPGIAATRQTQVVAVDLREAKTRWARIEAFETYGEKATLEAAIGDNRIEVKSENVARFVLEPPPRFLRAGQLVSLIVNGVESSQLFDPLLPMTWQKPGAKLEKTPTRCGPFKNALRDPFLLVYGDENDEKAARRMANEWKISADGEVVIKSAAQISDGDKAGFNLILFGTRATNPLLAEISDQLPLELTPDGYRSGEKTVAGENLGLRMIWKSPWNSKRLIGVCSGLWWGERLPPNHKWDLIPDFIVYDAQTEKDDTNRALEAGFFDGNFKRANE
jgi:poly(3-hydroxybutyrate) depolymerase